MIVVTTIISAVLQILVFAGIPFLFYLLTHRRVKGFFDYIGLVRPERPTMLYATVLSVAFVLPTLLLFFISPDLRAAATASNTVIGSLRSHDFSGTILVLVGLKGLVQTSFSEEILPRGFVAKRLINWLGFAGAICCKLSSLELCICCYSPAKNSHLVLQ
jgi:membrane protease YdiL (CAAX protease family)